VKWLPVFTRPDTVNIIFDSWRFLQRERGIALFGYVILENHLHWVAKGASLAESVKNFKSFTARSIVDHLEKLNVKTLLDQFRLHKATYKKESEFQVWQEGSQPKQIQNDEMMEQKLEYTHNNPVKRGYVDRPEHWRYSSARNYLGLPGLIDVVTDWR
jgi:REP element-mobilizing transposase RayT